MTDYQKFHLENLAESFLLPENGHPDAQATLSSLLCKVLAGGEIAGAFPGCPPYPGKP